MTISSEDAAAIAAHSVCESVLAILPSDRPIPLTEILAAYTTQARQLATVLIVSTTFQQVLEGCRVLPCALFFNALSLLSEAEQQRILMLFVNYLEQAKTHAELQAAQDLPQEFKLTAWSQLSQETQLRLQALQRRGRARQ